MWQRWKARLALGALAAVQVEAFSFNHTSGSQCQDITLQWDGGEAPYYATVVPSSGVPGARIQNISIPTGPIHTFRLDQAAGLSYVIVMSDATGFGTGGVTPILESGASSDTSCIGPMVGFDFYFYLDPANEDQQPQCAPLTVRWDTSITYPLQLLAIVPGSAAFSIPVPQTPDETSVVWDLAVREGAQYQLLMANAGLYGTGGATNLTRVVAGSSDCLEDDSPGQGSNQATIVPTITAAPSTSVRPSASSSSSMSTMRSEGDGAGSDRDTGSGGNNAGAIAGGVVGGLLGLALLLLLAFCYRRRRQRAYRDTEISRPMRQASMMQAATSRSRSSFDILGRAGAPPSPALPPTPVDQDDPFVSPYPAHRRLGSDRHLNTHVGAVASQDGDVRNGPRHAEYPYDQDHHATPAHSSLDLPPVPLVAHGHQRISSLDALGTGPGVGTGSVPSPARHSRKVSGSFSETAPRGPTFRDSYADAMSQVTAGTGGGTLGHGPDAPQRASQRLSRARWSVDELGEVPLPDVQGRGSEERRVIQHRDAEADGDVLELPPSYNQLRARNPDERSI